MKYFNIVKLFLILSLLAIPLMAVDCCRKYRMDDDYALYLTFYDSAVQVNKNDSIKISVLHAPNPQGGDSVQNFNFYAKPVFVNPHDTFTQAAVTFRGITDTLEMHYQTKMVLYEDCTKSYYRADVQLKRMYYTAHFLLPADGARHLLYPNSIAGWYNGKIIQMFIKP